jgi:chromate transporter
VALAPVACIKDAMSEPSSPPAAPAPATSPPVPTASLKSLFWLFFQIGAMSFGGGLVAWVYREVVEKRRWLPAPDLMSGIALSQVLPGINITNLAVYVGQRMRGMTGSIVSLIALLVVPFFAVIGLAAIYAEIDSIPWAHDFMAGVAAAAVGLVLSVTLKSVRAGIRGIGPIAVLIAVFVAVGILRWSLVAVVLVLAPISVALAWWTQGAKSDAR